MFSQQPASRVVLTNWTTHMPATVLPSEPGGHSAGPTRTRVLSPIMTPADGNQASADEDATKVTTTMTRKRTKKILVRIRLIELPEVWSVEDQHSLQQALDAYFIKVRRDAGCLRCDVMRMQAKGNADAQSDAGSKYVVYSAWLAEASELSSRDTSHALEWSAHMHRVEAAGGSVRTFLAEGYNFSTAARRLPAGQASACAVVVVTRVKPGHGEELLRRMSVVATESRREAGCLRYDLLRGEEDADLFCFYEVYSSPAAFEAHKSTPHCAEWGKFKYRGTAKGADGRFFLAHPDECPMSEDPTRPPLQLPPTLVLSMRADEYTWFTTASINLAVRP